jgi:hypothetical protein
MPLECKFFGKVKTIATNATNALMLTLPKMGGRRYDTLQASLANRRHSPRPWSPLVITQPQAVRTVERVFTDCAHTLRILVSLCMVYPTLL